MCSLSLADEVRCLFDLLFNDDNDEVEVDGEIKVCCWLLSDRLGLAGLSLLLLLLLLMRLSIENPRGFLIDFVVVVVEAVD